MKVSDLVRNKIDRLQDGYVFTYDDFTKEVKNESALKLALFKLVKAGKIERLSKGRFYKPKQGITAKLSPDEYEIVKDLLKINNKANGYITGLGIFNRLGLTSQMSTVIQIGSNFDKKQVQRGKYLIKYIRQWNKITTENIPLLQLLDCVRFIKNIPDTTVDQSYKRLIYLLRELSEKEIYDIYWAGVVHDIGKVGISSTIINKDGKLSQDEYETIKEHPIFGANILKQSEDLVEISDIVKHHHEWWNGNGYPQGLKGEEIPLNSRILAVVDAYDAMTNNRIYRDAMPVEDAIKELENCKGTQFDPHIIDIFLKN